MAMFNSYVSLPEGIFNGSSVHRMSHPPVAHQITEIHPQLVTSLALHGAEFLNFYMGTMAFARSNCGKYVGNKDKYIYI